MIHACAPGTSERASDRERESARSRKINYISKVKIEFRVGVLASERGGCEGRDETRGRLFLFGVDPRPLGNGRNFKRKFTNEGDYPAPAPRPARRPRRNPFRRRSLFPFARGPVAPAAWKERGETPTAENRGRRFSTGGASFPERFIAGEPPPDFSRARPLFSRADVAVQ